MKTHLYVLYALIFHWVSGSIDNRHVTGITQIAKRALQKSHEKSSIEKWTESFIRKRIVDQDDSLVQLIRKVSLDYLSQCTPIILYDNLNDLHLINEIFKVYPLPIIHGTTEHFSSAKSKILKSNTECISYILFINDVMSSNRIIGDQNVNKVIVIARSSQWRVYEYLAHPVSQKIVNLLVITKSDKVGTSDTELPYILYTHKLYIDAIASSQHQVLTSWIRGNLSRPQVSLFPRKMSDGFSGHRFVVSLAHQPPFVIKKGYTDEDDIIWDGIEIRLVNILAEMYNFTTDYREASDFEKVGSPDAVTNLIKQDHANLGISGIYVTNELIDQVDASSMYYEDCAVFITSTSTALPRYRAIMGPFHWSVWVALIFVYLFAILPLAFSDKHTLKHLVDKPEEIENMFWYVFGTFTNAFSFVGELSWNKSEKLATRLLVGFYWVFTIIITACYTGSIIAFVTLPVYPSTIDYPDQLVNGHYQIGTLDKIGWPTRFENSVDPITVKLVSKLDLVPTMEAGLKNITKAFFWPYAFLGSRAMLDYVVRTNFTTTNKRSLLHITSECFVPYRVALIFPKNSVYLSIFNSGLLRIVQSGLIEKMKHDVEWNMMRSATGKLLAANSAGNKLGAFSTDDRALTLDDTQGMFLLLAFGFLLGSASLLSEWLGGCINFCKRKYRRSNSIDSNRKSHDITTPCQKLDSVQHTANFMERKSDIDDECNNEKQTGSKGSNIVTPVIEVKKETSTEMKFKEQFNEFFHFEDVFGEKAVNNDKLDFAEEVNQQFSEPI